MTVREASGNYCLRLPSLAVVVLRRRLLFFLVDDSRLLFRRAIIIATLLTERANRDHRPYYHRR